MQSWAGKIGAGAAQRQIIALGAVVIWVAILMVFRMRYVEPRAWGAVCAAASPPLACAPRAALLWLQHFYLWGLGALLLGVWAFVGAPFGVGAAAVAIGIAGVINYNASWGMLAAVLGGWAWFVRRI